MSSGITSSSVAPAVGGPPVEHSPNSPGTGGGRASTFWCYECDVGVSLDRSAHPLLCPVCSGGFLEEMELPHAQDHRGDGSTTTLVRPPHRQFGDDDDESLPSPPPPPFPEFLLESDDDSDPRPHRVYFRTFAGLFPPVGTDSPVDEILADLVPDSDSPIAAGHAPAPRSSIDAIPAVLVTDGFLAEDPHRLCAVCKDEFVLGSEAKRLPCSHVYHGDCIVPWLSRHNSCPLCRSQLPVPGGSDRCSRSRSRPRFRVTHLPTFEAPNAPAITPANRDGGVVASPPPRRTAGHRHHIAARRPPRPESRDPWSYFLPDDEMHEEPTGNLVADDSYRAWLEAHVEGEPTNDLMMDDSHQSWLEQQPELVSREVNEVSFQSWLIAPSTRVLSQRQPDWDYFFGPQDDIETDRRQLNIEERIVHPQLMEDGAVVEENLDGRDPAISASESTLL